MRYRFRCQPRRHCENRLPQQGGIHHALNVEIRDAAALCYQEGPMLQGQCVPCGVWGGTGVGNVGETTAAPRSLLRTVAALGLTLVRQQQRPER